MTKEQFIALGLTEEQAEKAATASAEELKGYIPKTRFDEVNTAKKSADDALKERDKQLEELQKSTGDAAALKEQITKLQGDNKTAKEQYDADLKELRLGTSVKLALAGKVHDPDIVASLLDKSKIELDDSGAVKNGLDDQIKALQTSKAFLFVPEDKGGQFQFRGTKPPEGGGGSSGNEDDKDGAFGKRLADYAKQNEGLSKAQESYFK